MTSPLHRGCGVAALAFVLATAGAVTGEAQDATEVRARQLYAAAEYEEALALVNNADAAVAQQFRALSLIALGRAREADAAVRALVSAAPDYTASEEELPPRYVALVRQARRELLPPILRRLLAEGREYHQAKDYDRAQATFARLLGLASGADVRDVDGVADLRLLAEGFIEIARAARPPLREPAPPPVAAPPRPATATPPVARRQVVPPWTSASGSPSGAQAATSVGAVRVHIDRTGAVTSATMVRGVNAHYDLRVLEAARSWEYTPAMVNGVAVESDSIVEIRVGATK